MSNGEVKRWDIYFCSDDSNLLDDVAIEVDEEVRTARDGERRIEVMPVKDHERIVAELKADIAQLKVELGRPYDKVDRLFEANKKHIETIATQRRVIEKIKTIAEQMNCACGDRYSESSYRGDILEIIERAGM